MLGIKSIGDLVGFSFLACCCWIPVLVVIWLLIGGSLSNGRLKRAIASATDEQKAEILGLADQCAMEKPTEYVLQSTGELAEPGLTRIRLPQGLEKYPWAGRCVTVSEAPNDLYVCSFVESEEERIVIEGYACQVVPVPRVVTKNGKRRNVTSTEDLLKYCPALNEAVVKIFPESPVRFLDAIRPRFQGGAAQVGGSPNWLQEPERPVCRICGKHMALIIELYGFEGTDRKGDDTIYFFGCRSHVDETATFVQFT